MSPGDTFQEPHQELPANDRGKLDHALAILTETVQPGHDDILNSVGHAHLGKTFNEAIVTVRALEDAEIEEGLGDFLDEQRHALCLFHEDGVQLLRELRCAQDATGHGRGLSLRQAVERERGVEAPAPERQRVRDPVSQDEQQRHGCYRVHQRA